MGEPAVTYFLGQDIMVLSINVFENLFHYIEKNNFVNKKLFFE